MPTLIDPPDYISSLMYNSKLNLNHRQVEDKLICIYSIPSKHRNPKDMLRSFILNSI